MRHESLVTSAARRHVPSNWYLSGSWSVDAWRAANVFWLPCQKEHWSSIGNSFWLKLLRRRKRWRFASVEISTNRKWGPEFEDVHDSKQSRTRAIPQPGRHPEAHGAHAAVVPWRRAWRHRGGAAEALGVGVEILRSTHVQHSFTIRPCPGCARVFRWWSEAWQRCTTPVPRSFKMLTLAMRREHEDTKGDGYGQQRSREPAAAGDEFVDILQVQQLLLEGGTPASGGRGRGRGREQPPPTEGRGRLLDAFAAPSSYYYGSYGHHTPPATSVDDLVALWFAGPSISGVFYVPVGVVDVLYLLFDCFCVSLAEMCMIDHFLLLPQGTLNMTNPSLVLETQSLCR